MSFDGMMTRAMAKELADTLTGGRISKIYQPFKTDLLITIRANGKNHQLLISANASVARVHLTKEKYENPTEPPMFCMLLRKHLEGSIIETIDQLEWERIIVMTMKSKDELGDLSYKKLFIEIMGRHSNIILVDEKAGVIVDSIKHISSAQSTVRSILPGQPYTRPPEQEKSDPFLADEEDIKKKLDFNQGKLDRQLVGRYAGLSPLVAKEIIHLAGMANRDTVPPVFVKIMKSFQMHEYTPTMVSGADKEAYSLLPLTHLGGEQRSFSTVSELLDRFFYGKAERDLIKQQAHDLERFLRNERDKNEKKIKKLEGTLKEAEKAQQYQKYGELLTANLHLIKRGDKQVEVIDYYDEDGASITIPLNPQKSPSENAQQYFRRYTKAKNSVAVVKEQIKKAEIEIKYFEQLIQQMESASPKDVEEIREELMDEGYIRRRQKQGKKKKKDEKPRLEHYVSSTGIDIFVGKNNKQNEFVTNRFARQDEIWLHTKDIPGSHVLIRSTEPDETTILEAANLAAYFSKARLSSSVPVDYTKIRHVKKPNGAKPGFVIYDNQTTIHVTPNEDEVIKRRK
ncbi:Rqc2 family fibronectin-binding protein [Halalkalibacterium ligniniphilum]|uniref:Rqc2 family fibronectin-binding protein n=1 Tax=Halalkalibacterium ligniniphilum TaxID=1134413 RepID=UPI0003481D40|nr:NFACT RNA binding domain-containing protein [Halalkalibacterium ligniniphilum]